MDLDRVTRAGVKARHELLKQGYTAIAISRNPPYTCAPVIFAHAATPTVQPGILDSCVRTGQRDEGTSATASTSTWISGLTIAVGTRSIAAGSCVIISLCTAT